MSKYMEIRDDIKAKLAAIEDIGIVHGYSRFTVDWSRYILHFKDAASGRIKGWEISRRGAPEHLAGAFFRHHQFVLRGFLGFQDSAATDEIFQVLIEDVCDAFRTASPPAGAMWLYQNGDSPEQSPVQVQVIEERMFGAVLCHYCEIILTVTERILP